MQPTTLTEQQKQRQCSAWSGPVVSRSLVSLLHPIPVATTPVLPWVLAVSTLSTNVGLGRRGVISATASGRS